MKVGMDGGDWNRRSAIDGCRGSLVQIKIRVIAPLRRKRGNLDLDHHPAVGSFYSDDAVDRDVRHIISVNTLEGVTS